MTRRRSIRSVLHNFLGTYTSRYSDFDGYWLFGFLVDDVRQVKIDLMSTGGEDDDTMPMATARRLAVTKFAEQIAKVGLAVSRFRDAYLDITKSVDSRRGIVNSRVCSGYELRFMAKAVTDLGKTYASEMSLFVAPHDANAEKQMRTRNLTSAS